MTYPIGTCADLTKRTKKEIEEALRSRNFWDSCSADDVMSVIKHGLTSDVWRSALMRAHFQLVYYFAHDENDRIDFNVKNASWTKLTPDSVEDRILAWQKAEAAT